MNTPPSPSDIAADVCRALAEDLGTGDVTAALIEPGRTAEARVVCNEAAVLCGAPWFDEVFRQVDPAIVVEWQLAEGADTAAGTVVCTLRGPARALLSGERTALNYLQTLSGTATAARRYAQAVAGTRARILDTRKTVPGLRRAQKYAVRCGGGLNHRQGLYDAILIKENHIFAAGSLATAVRSARQRHPDLPLEVEVETLAELALALETDVDRIMLDNFGLPQMAEAVRITAGRVPL